MKGYKTERFSEVGVKNWSIGLYITLVANKVVVRAQRVEQESEMWRGIVIIVIISEREGMVKVNLRTN